MNRRALSLLLLVPFAAMSLRADEVRLRDGRVLYGKVTEEKDALAIETRDGTVRVQPDLWTQEARGRWGGCIGARIPLQRRG